MWPVSHRWGEARPPCWPWAYLLLQLTELLLQEVPLLQQLRQLCALLLLSRGRRLPAPLPPLLLQLCLHLTHLEEPPGQGTHKEPQRELPRASQGFRQPAKLCLGAPGARYQRPPLGGALEPCSHCLQRLPWQPSLLSPGAREYLIRHTVLRAGPGLAELSPQLLLILLATPAQLLRLLLPALKLRLPLLFPFQKCLFKGEKHSLRPNFPPPPNASCPTLNLCLRGESHSPKVKGRGFLLGPGSPSPSSGPGVPPPGC